MREKTFFYTHYTHLTLYTYLTVHLDHYFFVRKHNFFIVYAEKRQFLYKSGSCPFAFPSTGKTHSLDSLALTRFWVNCYTGKLVCAKGTTIWLPPVSYSKLAAFKRHSIYFSGNEKMSVETMKVRYRRFSALL